MNFAIYRLCNHVLRFWNWSWSWNDLRECQKLREGLFILCQMRKRSQSFWHSLRLFQLQLRFQMATNNCITDALQSSITYCNFMFLKNNSAIQKRCGASKVWRIEGSAGPSGTGKNASKMCSAGPSGIDKKLSKMFSAGPFGTGKKPSKMCSAGPSGTGKKPWKMCSAGPSGTGQKPSKMFSAGPSGTGQKPSKICSAGPSRSIFLLTGGRRRRRRRRRRCPPTYIQVTI